MTFDEALKALAEQDGVIAVALYEKVIYIENQQFCNFYTGDPVLVTDRQQADDNWHLVERSKHF